MTRVTKSIPTAPGPTSKPSELTRSNPCSLQSEVRPIHLTRPAAAWQTPHNSHGMGETKSHTIPAARGYAFRIKAGRRLRIVDLYGKQVVDFMAWTDPYSASTADCQHFSASYTRHALGGSAPPQVGECLYTNADQPMFKLVHDPVKTHDMLFMACNPGFYARLGKPKHRNCATNVAEAMEKFGMKHWTEVIDPFNVFQNTPYYSLKALDSSRAGDYVEMEALVDSIVALSSCPFTDEGFNGGNVTDVEVIWEVGEDAEDD